MPTHYKFNVKNDLAGFVAESTTVESNETKEIKIQVRAVLTSDEALFHKYVDSFYAEYFQGLAINPDAVSSFLVLLHDNETADLYINDFEKSLQIVAKRDIKAGELVMASDIANITQLSFPGIKITENDKVVFCAKVGWRFGLFFDLAPRFEVKNAHKLQVTKLDVDDLYNTLGSLYRYLSFYHVYKVLKTDTQFAEMIADGWFPFVELLSEYKDLDEIYKDKHGFENRVSEYLKRFDLTRVKRISDKWWSSSAFSKKRIVIEAGINAYLQNTAEGYVNSIKNLITEIEGILRQLYHLEFGKTDNVKSGKLITYITDKAAEKSGSEFSLLLPKPFLRYLKEVVFANFSTEDENISLSRNSSSHGVAAPEKYTKARAIQLILILDQIYFYK